LVAHRGQSRDWSDTLIKTFVYKFLPGSHKNWDIAKIIAFLPELLSSSMIKAIPNFLPIQLFTAYKKIRGWDIFLPQPRTVSLDPLTA